MSTDGPGIYVPPEGEALDAAGFSLEWCPVQHRTLLNDMVGLEAVSIDSEKEGFSWKFRPYPVSRFGYVIKRIIDKSTRRPQSFLEVGCGVGTKLVVVEKVFGIRTVGMDIFPEYIEASRDLVQYHDLRSAVIQCDATLYDSYGGYDIIFCNSPLWTWDEEYALEAKILDDMSSGAVIMLGNAKVKNLEWPLLCEEIALKAYQKP